MLKVITGTLEGEISAHKITKTALKFPIRTFEEENT